MQWTKQIYSFQGQRSETLVWHRARIHSLRSRWPPLWMAQKWFPRTSRTLLLWSGRKQSLWSWHCRGSLSGLSLCWSQHFRYQCRSYARPMGISSWTLWRNHYGWWSLGCSLLVTSRSWRIWNYCNHGSQTNECKFFLINIRM